MRPNRVVVISPSLDPLPGVTQARKPIRAEALIAKLAIEGFHEGVLHRLAWLNEVQLDSSLPSPLIEGLPREFRTIIDDD